jgi:hypothetical protein
MYLVRSASQEWIYLQPINISVMGVRIPFLSSFEETDFRTYVCRLIMLKMFLS